MKNKFIMTIIIAFALFLSIIIWTNAAADDVKSVVIVLEDGVGISALSDIDVNIEYQYSTIINAVCATADENDIKRISNINGVVGVYENIKFTACSEEEKDSKLPINFFDKDVDKTAGEGTVIAVLDNGFYLDHEVFCLSDNTETRLYPKDIDNIINFTNAYKLSQKRLYSEKVYDSRKIPFAYDYAECDTDVYSPNSHGTQMAGIAAGNPDVNHPFYFGAAPSAQILAMKVFNKNGEASLSAIIAALEDAYLLGADVANLSLGIPCGDTVSQTLASPLESIINELTNKGMLVVCSVGNQELFGTNSVWDKHFGYDNELVTMPDSGTVNEPAVLENTLAATGAALNAYSYRAFMLADTLRIIPTSDNNNDPSNEENKGYFNNIFDKQTIEYITIPGLGKDEDYSSLSEPITGKVALIKRGDITFAEKINNAEKHGAIAAVIYDNSDDGLEVLRTKMATEGTNIPAVLISKEDGIAMINAADKRIIADSRYFYITKNSAQPSPVANTAHGPTSDLRIKPEISFAGNGLIAANAHGTYSSSSGTSASCAQASGTAAAFLSKFKDKLDGKNTAVYLKNLMMSTALPMGTEINEQKTYYSVNIQGSGFLKSEDLKNAGIVITSDGKSKLEFGNNIPTEFEKTIKIENITDNSQKVKLSVFFGTRDYEDFEYALNITGKDSFAQNNGFSFADYMEKSLDDTDCFFTNTIKAFEDASVIAGEHNINQSHPDFSPLEIEIDADSSVEVTLKFSIENTDAQFDIYKNGMFVEGFVFAEGKTTASVPLLGYIGDFYNTPVFDNSLYENKSLYRSTYLYADMFDEQLKKKNILGTNNSLSSAPYILSNELAWISPLKSDNLSINIALLRNLHELKAEIYHEDGRFADAGNQIYAPKKAYSLSENKVNTYSRFIWTYRDADNEKYIYEDGKYYCLITGTDISGKVFEKRMYFGLDSEKPQIVNSKTYNDGDDKYLEITLKDNRYLQAVYAKDSAGRTIVSEDDNIFSDKFLLAVGEGGKIRINYNISNLIGDHIYFTVYDIAGNHSYLRIKVN